MLDQDPIQEIETEQTTDDAIYCANCGNVLTRTRWAISMEGHERVFINPAGRVFRVRCFSDVPGAFCTGEPATEHSWFPLFAWNFAICGGCNTHIGWRFIAIDSQQSFFCLMKTALTSTPPDRQP